jgi:hypothetical protein
MLSRNSLEPDDPKFAHEVAAGIIARARAKLSINSSGSSDGDRIRMDAAKSASGFLSKLETVSSMLLATSTPSSSADSKFKPEIERIKYKAAQLRNKAQIHAKQSADERNLHSPTKHSLLKKEDGKNDNFCLNEIEMKRLAMSELTKIPVNILEKRLHGLSDRLERHLSPERRSSPSSRGATPTLNQLSPKSGSDSPKSRSLAFSPQSSNRCGAVPCSDSKALNQNWVGGGPASCAAVMMAIAFCSRINNLYVSACARREHAARKIQRAYLIHLLRHFYGRSRKKRSAFAVLVRSLRKYVRRWLIRKRSRCVHLIGQFLTSVKLRRKFVCAVKHKFKMVCAFVSSPSLYFSFLCFILEADNFCRSCALKSTRRDFAQLPTAEWSFFINSSLSLRPG